MRQAPKSSTPFRSTSRRSWTVMRRTTGCARSSVSWPIWVAIDPIFLPTAAASCALQDSGLPMVSFTLTSKRPVPDARAAAAS